MYAIPQHLFDVGFNILRAGRDRDNFSDVESLWQPNGSRPFCHTLLSLNYFKLLLQYLCFDNWHTHDEQKLVDKFAATSKM